MSKTRKYIEQVLNKKEININFFMRFEQFFSMNQHSFHGDNCSTCCDLVEEFLNKEGFK